MKRVYLVLIILSAFCFADVLLHAGIIPMKEEKNTEIKKSSSVAKNIVLSNRNSQYKLSSATSTHVLPQVKPAVKSTIDKAGTSKHNYIEPAIGMEFISVPGGCFQMGGNTGDFEELQLHEVCLDGFNIGKFEVTQEQWQLIMGTNPAFFSYCGGNCPVDSVSWNDVQVFISKLNSINTKGYRLPTEEEWEYACKFGKKTERFCGGDDVDLIAWYDKNSSSRPHQTGLKQPNSLGIHDMSGNVWEWVGDWYHADYYNGILVSNTSSPLTGPRRVMRGGSWYNDQKNVRAMIRGSDDPDHHSINLGFRLVY